MKNELLELQEQVKNCKKCELWKGRKNAVFGEGPEDAKIMLIGLGPGYNEDQQGRPFVGAAGKLLNKLLSYAGLKREEVYIANIIKSYLPDNKATKDQIEACTPYLERQIELIKPKIIILLGNVAVKYIFEKYKLSRAPMRDLHNTTFSISTLDMHAKLIPMYHPSAALRNPGLRNQIMEDWVKIKENLH